MKNGSRSTVAWRLKPPERCPQCESIVWDRRPFVQDFFTEGLSWVCLGCGFELFELVDEFGTRQQGERWATCRCCGRLLQSGEAAQNGYGAACASGQCRCHDRAVLRDLKRAGQKTRPPKRLS